jgi:hypothetical protein
MGLDLAAFEQGVRDYWIEIASRSQQVQARERAFPDLAVRFASRSPRHFTREDLEEIFIWKYTDARWRDRALEGIRQVKDESIILLTSRIGMHDVQATVRLFHGAIYGVGIAGVSAILTAARPDLYAVIDVFALIAIDHHYTFAWMDRVPRDKNGKLQADENSYAPYVNFCGLRAAELSKAAQKPWKPRDIDISLWAIGKQLADGHSSRCS